MGPDRFILHGYVCGPDCVRASQHIGAVTFHQIYVERPDGCRYAVAVDHQKRVLVWDLYDVTSYAFNAANDLEPPLPIRVTEDVDSAIVATALLYNEE